MNHIERLEHMISLCRSARQLAVPERQQVVVYFLEMLLLQLSEELSGQPEHRSRLLQSRSRPALDPEHIG